MKKATIEDMQAIALKKGGKCLSRKYVNQRMKLKWQCKCGYKWEATPDNIVNNGSWCPRCAGQIVTIKDIQETARSRGGKCLDKSYIKSTVKMRWECSEGHRWKSTAGTVRGGSWCPECAKKNAGSYHKLSLEDFRLIAIERGGKLLSEKYKNVDTKLRFRCSEGHEWEAPPRNIRKGSWCRICSNKKRADRDRTTLNEIMQMVIKKKGELLSDEYSYCHQKIDIKCEIGHIFSTKLDYIKSGRWCPECSQGTGERITRHFFEQIFNKPFPSKKPLWLKNAAGNRMHFDGYNEELKLAFEHQGEYHYSIIGRYSRNLTELNKRKKDDRRKRFLARKHDVKLLEIPEVFTRTKISDLKNTIINLCEEAGIRIPKSSMNKKISFDEAYSPKYFEELKKIVKIKKGEILSESYLTARAKLRYRCAKGHEWEATPDNIISKGSWCPRCAGRGNYSLEKFNDLAKKNKGKCTSKEFTRSADILEWECKHGHKWKAKGTSIIRGHWCPYCGKTKGRPIIVYRYGKEIGRFKTMSDACRKFKISLQTIRDHRDKGTENIKGFSFQTLKKDKDEQ